MTDCGDPAYDIVTKVIVIMRAIFGPEGAGCAPVGGGTNRVNFVTGEGPDWDPMVGRYGEDSDDAACQNPFVWVRLVSRYRSEQFPEPTVINTCGGISVIALELGVGRCVNIDPVADYDVIAQEAEWGLDDSYRLDKVVCILTGPDGLGKDALIAADPILPSGPEGGGIVWSTNVTIGITS